MKNILILFLAWLCISYAFETDAQMCDVMYDGNDEYCVDPGSNSENRKTCS
jgi:hypothetical protein